MTLFIPVSKAPPSLQCKGWSFDPVDLCWMACAKAGHRKIRECNRIGNQEEIVLCVEHAEINEGYLGRDPQNAHDWPWRPILEETE